MTKKILLPLPAKDFDPTEAAVTWKMLRKNSDLELVFTTPNGKQASADFRMLTGSGLGIWAPLLKANAGALDAYEQMLAAHEFQNPLSWEKASAFTGDFSAIALAGGHAAGMKEYLESQCLQKMIADFFAQGKIVGAICHGVVLAARSKNIDGKSVLHGYKTTALLKSQELGAWSLTCFWLKNYYRTYPESVEDEVKRALADKKDFYSGPLPLLRDSESHLDRGFIVEDKNYISARWPGDAHLFGKKTRAKNPRKINKIRSNIIGHTEYPHLYMP